MSVYIFDTETTDRKDGEIIEAALIGLSADSDEISTEIISEFVGRYRPTRSVAYGAMAVHHILPIELIDAPPSSSFKLPDDARYLIGHSVDFDWTAAGSPAHVKRIDTHAMAQWLWPDTDGYSQVALLYLLEGATPKTRDMVRQAHGALEDARMNLRLLKHILQSRLDLLTWEDLWAYSEKCRIPRTCPLKRWEGVLLADMDYSAIDWCLRQDWIDPYFRKGLRQVIEQREHSEWDRDQEELF